jgi:AbrB family looped-hinge helix DNA binding protein
MTKNDKENFCCDPRNLDTRCCRVESIVSVDNKGQIVLPSGLRKKMDIDEKGKLVVVSLGDPEEPTGIILLKANIFGDMVKNFLGPVMKDIFSNNNENENKGG